MITESELNIIYKYAYNISQLRKVVSYIRILDDRKALRLLKSLLKDLELILQRCFEEDYMEKEDLKQALLSMADIKDIILLGDVLENVTIPILQRWIKTICFIDESIDDRYRLESSASGFLTIKDNDKNIYLHSKIDPMDESLKIVERQYDCTYPEYAVWGCGLGYQIYQLYVVSEGAISITVYETNKDLVDYAFKYGVLSWIPEEVLRISIVENYEEYNNKVSGNTGRMYLKPYILACDDAEQKNKLKQVFSRYVFLYDATHNLKLNYYENRKLNIPYVSEIDYADLKRDMVIIGAGPSLDHNIDVLRTWQGKKTLIAAGTVWKKLLREGIKPDFVIIMDPYDIVFQQVDGIEDLSATLLITSQAYWKVGRYYEGKKYLIPQFSGIDEITLNMEKDGITHWIAGGSVTVFELEFAVRMFADKIYLVGVDLSLPGGLTHAEGTTYRQRIEMSDLEDKIPVEDVNGGIVYTNHILIESKTWFELIMGETEGVEYINMSDVGVKLKGTIPYIK